MSDLPDWITSGDDSEVTIEQRMDFLSGLADGRYDLGGMEASDLPGGFATWGYAYDVLSSIGGEQYGGSNQGLPSLGELLGNMSLSSSGIDSAVGRAGISFNKSMEDTVTSAGGFKAHSLQLAQDLAAYSESGPFTDEQRQAMQSRYQDLLGKTDEQWAAETQNWERRNDIIQAGYTDEGMISKVLTAGKDWSDNQFQDILGKANQSTFGNASGYEDFALGTGRTDPYSAWEGALADYADEDAVFKAAYDPMIGAGGWLSDDVTWEGLVTDGIVNPEYGSNPAPAPTPDPNAPDQGGTPLPGSGGDTGGGTPPTGSVGGGTTGGGTTGGGSSGGNGNDSNWEWSIGFPDINFGDTNMDEIFGDLDDWLTGGEGGSVWNNISDLIGDIDLSNVIDIDFGSLFDEDGFLGQAWGGLEQMFGGAWESMEGIFGDVGELFTGAWESLDGLYTRGLEGMQSSALGQSLGTIGAALINKQGMDRQLDLYDKYGQMSMDRADPFFDRREKYGQKMDDLMSNPMDTTMLDPSYQWRFDQGLNALTRAGAAGGKLGSGNILTAATNYGQGAASQEFQNIFNRYGSLSGATTGNFGASSQAAAGAGGAMANIQGDMYGLGSGLLGKLF
jgi:hypothetical protein